MTCYNSVTTCLDEIIISDEYNSTINLYNMLGNIINTSTRPNNISQQLLYLQNLSNITLQQVMNSWNTESHVNNDTTCTTTCTNYTRDDIW